MVCTSVSLQKVWNFADIVHCFVVTTQCDGEVAEVRHECIAFPA